MPWMTDLFYDPSLDRDARGPFSSRPLSEICIPGTHDSGCYVDHVFNAWGRTQTLSVADQLAGGIRYFDIRPCFYRGEIYTYHGFGYYGDRLDGPHGILSQVRNFMQSLASTDRELVILNISHFYNFTDVQHDTLIDVINREIGGYLVSRAQSQINLFGTAYDQLLSDNRGIKSRVAIIYDGALDQNRLEYVEELIDVGGLPAGFFVLAPKYAMPGREMYLFDQYANLMKVEDSFLRGGMRSDQLEKLRRRDASLYTKKDWAKSLDDPNWYLNRPRGVPSTLHLLSWTLTPQPFNPLPYAQQYANPALCEFFSNQENWKSESRPAGGYYDALYDPQINIIYTDDFSSETHVNPGTRWDGMALPVAIAARINVGPVGPENTW